MAFQLLQTWQDAGKMLEILVLRSIISCVSQVEVPDLGFEAFIQINVHIFNPPPPLVQVTFSADKYFLYCLPCLQETKMFVA